jgi:3-methylcrotonyl-CoA carboxylase alpha subunit
MITGLDLVQMQLRLARGDDFSGFAQHQVAASGHAIELRVYAENPAKNYMPSPGKLSRVRYPSGDGIRVDTGFEEGDEITAHYDPLIAKLIVRGVDRPDAIARGRAMLGATRVEGPATNLALLRAVLGHPAFVDGLTFTNFLDIHKSDLLAPA